MLPLLNNNERNALCLMQCSNLIYEVLFLYVAIMYISNRPLSEHLKPLKLFILDEESLEPLKCLFGPLSDFIFTFEPVFSGFCPQNAHYLGF